MWKMLKRLTKKEILLILLSLIFIVSQVWLDLKIPDFMMEITKLVQTPGSEMKDILIQGGYMLLCAFGSLISAFIVGYAASKIGTYFAFNLRKSIFSKVLSFGMAEIKDFSTSSLITRNTNDVNQVQLLIVMSIQMLIKAPIMAIWAITKIANKGIEFTIITAVGVLIVVLMVTILTILVLPKFKIVQSLTDNLNRITRENLTGIRVIRAFNAELFQTNRFDKANTELTNTSMFIQKLMAMIWPIMGGVMSFLSLSIYWVGAYLIDSAGQIERLNIFGNMVVFSSYAVQVIMSFMMLVMLFILYPRASVSAKRINEVLDTESSIKDGIITEDISELKGSVEFKNVSFKYPDAEDYILKDINFKINPGETVAFIGSTGSGKSTLISLIPRIYDASNGEVLVNGVNVKEYKNEYLNNKLGYIPQKAILFKGTIRKNVSFGKVGSGKVKLNSVKKAIEIAQSKNFVEKMKGNYNAKISQAGINLSGGQKQRLSMARAIARNPEIYIFDDSFSALDFKTDYSLRKGLKKYVNDATIIIVAQRIGTIKDADKIVVLDEGRAVGIGTHEELLNNCKVYKEIASSQLSSEELAYE